MTPELPERRDDPAPGDQPVLHQASPDVITPLLLKLADDDEEFYEPPPPRRTWVRVLLVAIVMGWLSVFAVARWLNPYEGGRVWLEQTHRQLGLAPCVFRDVSGLPCPSCGMTTSFALLMRGDVVNSMRANFAGTLLALIGLVYIPWAIASMWRGRWLGVREVEPWLIRLIFAWVAIMLLRWSGLLAWQYFNG